MSGCGRKRTSKWDLKDAPQHSLEGGHDDSWHGSYHDKKSPTGWRTPKFAAPKDQKWVEETNDCLKNDNTMAWDGDGNCNMKLSPGLDAWRQERRTLSQNRSFSRSHRGRSRSRSRSRSPGRAVDNSRSRSGVSNEICRNFASGKCWRGERCQYLHSGNQNFEDRRHTDSNLIDRRDNRGSAWSGALSYDTREYNARNGRSGDFREGMTDRKSSRDSSSEHFDHETRWGGGNNIPCRFYSAGNCRNGKNCRFSHHAQPVHSVDGRSRMDRVKTDHNLDDEENLNKGFSSWTDSKASDSTKWDKWDSKWDSEKDFFVDNDTSVEIGKSELMIPCNTPKNTDPQSGGSKAIMDADNWQSKIEEPASLMCEVNSPPNITMIEEETEYVSQNPQSTFDMNKSDEEEMHPHPSSTSIQPIVYGEPFSDYNPISSLSLPSDDRNASNAWLDLNFSAQLPNTFNSNNNISSAQPLLTSDVSEHAQLELFPKRDQPGSTLDVPGQSFTRDSPVLVSDVGARGQQTKLPDSIREENSEDLRIQLQLLENESKKLGITVADTLHVTTGISSSQDIVNSEQLAQLTNLSASLAQLLGNGQQLPQLYAALNSSNVVNPCSQVISTSIQPNPTVGSEKLYDPISDAVEPIKPGELIDGSSSENAISKDLNDAKLVGDHGMSETNRIEAKESKKNEEEAPKIGDLSNAGGNEKVEAMKKSKDPKGIRAFKFALAEFVKELLKPAWKDGQIDKDGYKVIAKKVVDKVTNTIGSSIPQKDKIDNYLSSSKPKLSKLVQAYVERHQKS